MSNLTCPKCGGSDYFLSKRNIVKGMGWAQRGSLKSIPVCRVCDEMMMTLHSNQNIVNKIGKYGLIVIGVFFALLILGWLIASLIA
jgi:small-conductance mechanosensitive channel